VQNDSNYNCYLNNSVFGALIFLILVLANLVLVIKPHSQTAKDIFIGKGENWRDRTHFKSAYAIAWADFLIILLLIVMGNIGVLMGHLLGYILWAILGGISIYFSIVFWVMEKEYTYPANGPLAYYTCFWGLYLYWGIAAVIYSIVVLSL
jgi:Ca2+/Na+ antiporter